MFTLLETYPGERRPRGRCEQQIPAKAQSNPPIPNTLALTFVGQPYVLRFPMIICKRHSSRYVLRTYILFNANRQGWLGGAKVSFILRHRGAQLILAYSWARPAILVAGKGRGGCFYFFCFFTFIPVPLSSLSLSFISSTISSIFFLPFSGRRHKMTHKG